MTRWEFEQKQSLPYNIKIIHAEQKIDEFCDWAERNNKNLCLSIGGLGSLTLYKFLKKLKVDFTPISVSILEDKSIQKIHHTIPDMVYLKPYKSKVEVIREFGFPIISKEKAAKIEIIQTPNLNEKQLVKSIMIGITSKNKYSEKTKLPDKWIKLFGGYYNYLRPDLNCQCAPFKVSDRCCKWMKEQPCIDWQNQFDMIPFLGLMASEGGQREMSLIQYGCNYYGDDKIRSCPFAIFNQDNLLQLALDLSVEVPEIYGEIIRLPDGKLKTTKAERTGCSMCGFGIHLEKRPHRFDRLKENNYDEWKFWMYDMGWGEVLSYIGIEW